MNEAGDIIYKAAAEELIPGELSKHQLEPFTIRKGDYIYMDVKNFMQNIPAIGQAFNELKSDKRIDPEGVALEWYLNEADVRCMIRIK
jgi:aryl-alcohol dehydrogenase-like predicted oxidoreductase